MMKDVPTEIKEHWLLIKEEILKLKPDMVKDDYIKLFQMGKLDICSANPKYDVRNDDSYYKPFYIKFCILTKAMIKNPNEENINKLKEYTKDWEFILNNKEEIYGN